MSVKECREQPPQELAVFHGRIQANLYAEREGAITAYIISTVPAHEISTESSKVSLYQIQKEIKWKQ